MRVITVQTVVGSNTQPMKDAVDGRHHRAAHQERHQKGDCVSPGHLYVLKSHRLLFRAVEQAYAL